MWRIVQGFPRVLRSQWGSSRQAPAICYAEDSGEQCPLQWLSRCQDARQGLLPPFLHSVTFHTRCDTQREPREARGPQGNRGRHTGCCSGRGSGGSGQQASQCHCNGEQRHGDGRYSESRDWSEWFSRVRFGHSTESMLEAVGWGTVLILGAELTHLWHLTSQRPVPLTGREHSWSHCLYQLAFLKETWGTRKQILPNAISVESQSHDQSHDTSHDQSHDEGEHSSDSSSEGYSRDSGHGRSGDFWEEGQRSSWSCDGSEEHFSPSGKLNTLSLESPDLGREVNDLVQHFYKERAEREWRRSLSDNLQSDSCQSDSCQSDSCKSDISESDSRSSSLSEWSESPSDQDSATGTAFQDTSSPNTAVPGPEEVVQEWEKLQAVYQGAAHNHTGIQALSLGQEAEAVSSWRRAAELGYGKALYNLGLSYQLGLAGEPDIHKAMQLYRQAASQGHQRALYNLAQLYLAGVDGQGRQDNKDRQDRQDGQDRQDRQDSKDSQEGVQGDRLEGKQLMEQAANLGLAQAQTEVGVLYTEDSDWQKAVKFFTKAAQQNEARAVYYLGVCYEKGLGVRRDHTQAAQLYRKSCDLGQADACHNLAVFYEKGLGGLPSDKDAALNHYTKATQCGTTGPKKNMTRLRRSATNFELSNESQPSSWKAACCLGNSTSSPSLRRSQVNQDFGIFDLSQTSTASSMEFDPSLTTRTASSSQPETPSTSVSACGDGRSSKGISRGRSTPTDSTATYLRETGNHKRTADVKLGNTKVTFDLGENEAGEAESPAWASVGLDWSLEPETETSLPRGDCLTSLRQGSSQTSLSRGDRLTSLPLEGSFGSLALRGLRQSTSAAANLHTYNTAAQTPLSKLHHTSSTGELRRAACM